MRFDLHIHTTYSQCSILKPEELIDRAKKSGLHGICITDHNTMKINNQINEGIQVNGLVVILGMEYDTPQGDFLIFGPFEDLKPGKDAATLLKHVDQKNGIAIAAHPTRINRPLDTDILNAGLIKIIESTNGRSTDNENLAARALAVKYNLDEIGGSDSHSIEEIGALYTEFNVDISSREDLIDALKNQNFITNHPAQIFK